MSQWVKLLTLDFDSAHDLTVCGIEPRLGSALTAWSLLEILFPSLPLPCSCSLIISLSLFLSLSLLINKHFKNENGCREVYQLEVNVGNVRKSQCVSLVLTLK